MSKICAGSAADRSHNMAVGDKILSVNDNDLLEATHLEALAMIQGAGDMIKLVLAEDPIGALKQPAGQRPGPPNPPNPFPILIPSKHSLAPLSVEQDMESSPWPSPS